MSTRPESAAAARAEALAIVEQALEATGLSPTALANAAGVAPSTINRFRKHPDAPVLGTTTLAKLARLAKLGPRSTVTAVPIVGYVGAGERVYPVDDHLMGGGLEEVDMPERIGPGCVAVIVRGDSMAPAYQDGDVVVYRVDDGWRTSCLRQEVACKTATGETYVKRLDPGKSPGRYTLHSYNADPIQDVEVEWAGMVLMHDKTGRSRRTLRRA